jgi:hypothetical protein
MPDHAPVAEAAFASRMTAALTDSHGFRIAASRLASASDKPCRELSRLSATTRLDLDQPAG